KIFKKLITFPGLENCRLILMGKLLLPDMREFVNQNNLSAQVIELGTVSDEDLRAFYCLATALIFPSFQEGFGVPVIEAQACGC
ncbi:glycosyltransferase, partial [Pseudomonas frederiksbergensis]|nr:glycosyltransferase [Pseudomonas frederiksbergensis]